MKTQLNALAAALTLGLGWGLCLFLWTLVALKWQMGTAFLSLIDWYPGYEMTTQGAFVGLVWGFVDGFVSTYIIVWVYNFFSRKLGK